MHRISGLLCLLLVGGLLGGLTACTSSEAPSEPDLFHEHAADSTGVTFENRLAESADLNILNYLYYYNGGGVAVGDVNGDDRPDLYFTANEGDNALYLNQGDFQFEEVTAAAGVAGTGDWTTGVTMADVNGDGRLDLYVSVVSQFEGLEGHNQLYINQGAGENGVPTFAEKSAEYGLDHRGFSTQGAFFDYDGDGDLDLYLLNHAVHSTKTYGRTSLRKKRDPRSSDKLYENRGGTFVDVSEEAGIIGGSVGYGLGVVVTDVDTNGCPDLYVANDFHENDYLYVNNCDGTFTEAIEPSTKHVSHSSMGVDAGDINNDGRPDFVVLDMLPWREEIVKTSVTAESYDVRQIQTDYGYHHQYARNTLQLNQGTTAADGEGGPKSLRFSDVGFLAGVQATDWSWAPLFADFDLDGRQDLFVANGIYRRPNDLDYINYVSNREIQQSLQQITKENLSLLQRMPQVEIPNAAFRNQGDLQFEDVAADWGLDHAGFSNGAAYGDFDGDGDLDLVTNNINEPASILENRADSLRAGRSLTVSLQGTDGNTHGVGARVTATTGDRTQMREQVLTRGYQSSVQPLVHFGLGERDVVDTLTVTWPDGRVETRTGVAAGQHLTLRHADARPPEGASPDESGPPEAGDNRVFATATAPEGLDFRHRENEFLDWNRERLIPHKVSTEGPALAVGDVNGDGREDVFVGGAKWQSAQLYVQEEGGRFTRTDSTVWAETDRREDVDAAFFDADGDGDLDLYVVSAGGEFWGDAEALGDRLYLNDGSGTFRRAEDALPESVVANGGSVTPGDFDDDGDVDLIVGNRVVAREYGKTPESALLENDGTGTFTDVTDRVAPGLRTAGMVTDAAWLDVNGDDRLDVAVVGTWMPIRVFLQQPDGTFADATADLGLAETGGWWNAVQAADLDGDGDDDLVAGNLGLNSTLHAAPDEPARLYRNDFDDNGDAEAIVTYYRDGTSYPMAGRDLLASQIESIKRKYPSYKAFAGEQIDDLFSQEKVASALVKEAHTFASVAAINDGGTFDVRPLPSRAQFAPMFDAAVRDWTGDGQADVVMAGNFYGVRPMQGRYDASYGTVLRGDTSGTFTALPPAASGLWIDGQARALAPLTIDGTRYLLVARNDATLQVVRHVRRLETGTMAAVE